MRAIDSELLAVELEYLCDFLPHSHAKNFLALIVYKSPETCHQRVLEDHIETLNNFILLNHGLLDSLSERILGMITGQNAHYTQEAGCDLSVTDRQDEAALSLDQLFKFNKDEVE